MKPEKRQWQQKKAILRRLRYREFSLKNSFQGKITYIVVPFNFINPWIGTNLTIHVDIISFRNSIWVNTTSKTQSCLWWIWKEKYSLKNSRIGLLCSLTWPYSTLNHLIQPRLNVFKVFLYCIRANRMQLLIRTPGDIFWVNTGHFQRKFVWKNLILDKFLQKMTIVHSQKLPIFDGTLAIYLRGYGSYMKQQVEHCF